MERLVSFLPLPGDVEEMRPGDDGDEKRKLKNKLKTFTVEKFLLPLGLCATFFLLSSLHSVVHFFPLALFSIVLGLPPLPLLSFLQTKPFMGMLLSGRWSRFGDILGVWNSGILSVAHWPSRACLPIAWLASHCCCFGPSMIRWDERKCEKNDDVMKFENETSASLLLLFRNYMLEMLRTRQKDEYSLSARTWFLC